MASVKAQAPNTISKSFALWPPTPASTAQSIRLCQDGLYYLMADKANRRWVLGAANISGQALFEFVLPGKQYYFMDVRASGGILVQRAGAPLEEFNRKGEKVAEWQTGESPLRQKLVGDSIIRLLPSKEVEVVPLGTSPRRRIPVPQLATVPRDFSFESASPSEVRIVDRELGSITRVDLTRNEVRHFSATASEIRRSAEYYAKQTSAPKDAHSLSVLATGIDARGNVLAFVAPYTIQRSVILRLSPDGTPVDRIYITLPGRTSPSFKIPWKLGQIGDQMCLVFLQGGVACYSGVL